MLFSVPPPVRRVLLRALQPTTWRWIFAVYSLAWALCVGMHFFSALEHQLFLSQARTGALNGPRPWSAPLDDVFIHFDFARSAARGYPFQWSEGNGYSSGGTSLLYPFVLSIGYRIGYDGLQLMLWAGIVATISVWCLLLSVARLFRDLPAVYTLLIPPVMLSVGALNWSLWSGMEVAFFLAIWGACLVTWDDTCRAPVPAGIVRKGAVLGLACLLLVATRPESAPVVACFVLSALTISWKRINLKQRTTLLLAGALPGAAVVGAQTLANWLLTGETSAAGALVKLEAYHPHLTSAAVWDSWLFHLKYQVTRVTEFHLSDIVFRLGALQLSAGWILWLFAGVPLFFLGTRRVAILLWLSAIVWLCTVSLNGQVRWQNERYTMPAVAWLLCSAALGVALLIHHGVSTLREALPAAAGGSSDSGITPKTRKKLALRGFTLLAISAFGWSLYWTGQLPRQRDQLWFFGRAARNIFDQHVQVGNLLKRTPASRVLVGDAGAIPYVSDLPALDIIGLGGFKDYPFARATRMGLPAALELLQRMPAQQRPDVMALYPDWWGDLPLWFGKPLFEVPVRGNVICGGSSKVVYVADWDLFTGSTKPTSMNRREQVVADVDFADLISEKTHHVEFQRTVGYVAMKALPHPTERTRDLWDAGRILSQGGSSTITLNPHSVHEPLQLVLRVAPTHPVTIRVTAGSHVETLQLEASEQWLEPRLTIPPSAVRPGLPVTIEAVQGEAVLYHLWGLQSQ